MKERWTPAYDRMFDPDHELAGDQACRRFAWLDLCHMARWEDGNRIIRGSLVPLKRGEFVVSVRYLCERWGWSKGKVARFLDLLCSQAVNKLGTVTETPVGTVYRVVNYDTYARGHDGHGDTDRDRGGTPTGHPRDTNGTGTGQSRDKEQKGLEGKKGQTGNAAQARSRAKALPDSWDPNDGHREIAQEQGVDLEAELVKFRDHAKANGRTQKDWDAAFRNWLRQAKRFAPAPSRNGLTSSEEEKREAERRREAARRASEEQRDKAEAQERAGDKEMAALRDLYANLDSEAKEEIGEAVQARLRGLGFNPPTKAPAGVREGMWIAEMKAYRDANRLRAVS